MKNPKPEPVVTSTACSLCGLDWDAHGDKPTAQTCIDLLRVELAKRSRTSYTTLTASGAAVTPIFGTTGSAMTMTPLTPGSSTFSASFKRPDDPDMGVPAKTG